MISRSRTMRDAVLVLVGALSMHVATSFFGMFHPDALSGDILPHTEVDQPPQQHNIILDEHIPPKKHLTPEIGRAHV